MKKVLFSLILALVCLPMAIAQTKDAPVFQRIDKTVCGSFTWDLTGETYTTDTAVLIIRNDTAYGLFLTMAAPTYDTATAVELNGICSVTFRDSVFTTAGTFDATMPTTNGCDSIVRLSITLVGIDSTNQTVTACDSMLAPWGEMLYASANIVKDTTVDGCLRHDVLNLTINHSFHGDTLEITADCSYQWNNMTIIDTLVHSIATTTVNGCDSTSSIRVISFSNHLTQNDTAVACDEYLFWGDTLTASGNYVHVDTTGECVTTYNLNLTVNPTYTDTAAVVVRNVEAGCYYTFAGETYTDTGVVHYGFLATAAGCDSLAAIRITNYTNHQYDTARIEFCGYRYPWGNSEHYGWTKFISNPSDPNPQTNPSLATSDEYVSADTTYTAADGCVFHRHIDVKFIHLYDSITRSTACDKDVYTFNARNGGTIKDTAYFTESGVYTTDTNGVELYSRNFQTFCVTHHKVKVNVIKPDVRISDTIVVNTCDRYTFKMGPRDADSARFTSDTLYTRIRQYRTNMACYDTVIPLDITIRHSSFIDNNVVACDRYTWAVDSITYTHSIIINDTLRDTTNVAGCDSIGRLRLTIQKSPEVRIEGNWILEPGETATLNAICTTPGVTYNWYKNNVLQNDNHTATFVVEPNGMENVDVHLATTKAYSNISCTSDNWITVTTNVGIDDVDAMHVNIYPNPTTRILNLQSAEGISEVVIYNMVGQQVLRQQCNGETVQLDLGALVGGNYTLAITAANGEQTTRKINVTK